MSKGSIASIWRGAALALVPGALVLATAVGCKKDEPPPPLPEPKAVETAEAPLELKPEDAGPPVQEKAAPKPGGTARKSGLAQCCAALRQNAASAPEPTKGYMIYAAGACDLAAAQGKDKQSAVGVIQSALKGAGLPADCK
jgi:hypothetical protein